MIPLFLGFTALNLLSLLIVSGLGWGVSAGRPWSNYHQLAGVIATIVCCGVHCVVFTYFIATAKWVQHAVSVKQLDPAMIAPTRSFKAQAFPAALSAMACVFVAAVAGVATWSYQLRPIYHHVAALLALAVNVVAALVEYRAIARNGALIDRILAMIVTTAEPGVAERQTLRT